MEHLSSQDEQVQDTRSLQEDEDTFLFQLFSADHLIVYCLLSVTAKSANDYIGY